MALFVDYVKLLVKSGKGGPGCISFRREKYVPRGGPDGGDGGAGGSVIFQAKRNMSTLLDLKFKKSFAAENGRPGEGNKKHGKNGKNVIISVPVGTVIYKPGTREVIADLQKNKQKVRLCHGGKGGLGNTHFASPTNQTPRYAQPGLPGEEMELDIELKLLADIGLLGYPNVGKSSILSKISASKPKIGDYPFTTIVPNLGVVKKGDMSFTVADIPGLIEGAHLGSGLGDKFLRHIERTRFLVHVLDLMPYDDDRTVIKDFDVINNELKNYMIDLSHLDQIVVLNKSDLIFDKSEIDQYLEYFKQKGYTVYVISAATGQGLEEMVSCMAEKLKVIIEDEFEEENEEIDEV